MHLDLPSDVLYNGKELESVRIYPPRRYRALRPPVGDLRLIDEAAEILSSAEMPLIHAGSGVLRSAAWTELLELAEYLGAVVTTTLGARGAT